MPFLETIGAAAARAYGQIARGAPVFVDDVFSTYLHTGNGSTQTITNGIDLAGRGGLVWIKQRGFANGYYLADTMRGIGTSTAKYLKSETTAAEVTTSSSGISSFNNSGFTVTGSTNFAGNNNGDDYVSWTFRKQPKFFDVVTYTGDGTSSKAISHSLGSVPGMIVVKRTDTTGDWIVYHRSLANTEQLRLNAPNGLATASTAWASTTPTSTQFFVGDTTNTNFNTGTYVAYLFAHGAGGFGTSGNDNIISCGSFTGTATINLGWEPQWLLIKKTNASDDWIIMDNARGWTINQSGNSLQVQLLPNTTNAENSVNTSTGVITPTGFSVAAGSNNYVYIAIRRSNKPPTSGTSVFNVATRTGTGSTLTVTNAGFPIDAVLIKPRNGNNPSGAFYDRMRGGNPYLSPASSGGENVSSSLRLDVINGYTVSTSTTVNNGSGIPYVDWSFKRAPGFMDVVHYLGTGANLTVNHNLGVVPELIFVKSRTGISSWLVYSAPTGNTKYLLLDGTDQATTEPTAWNNTSPTSSVFTVGTIGNANTGGTYYIAYLFASYPGISKVGSYTGNGGTVNTNGTAQTINCGFSAGARFVLIKRTDSASDWYTFDTARGIVAAADPYLLLNSVATEVTTVDVVDPDNSGFIINQTSTENLNVTGATYIYLAIA